MPIISVPGVSNTGDCFERFIAHRVALEKMRRPKAKDKGIYHMVPCVWLVVMEAVGYLGFLTRMGS